MTNTQKRILSGLFLILTLVCCFLLGSAFFLGLVFIFGVFSVDELYCNFLRKKRGRNSYFLGQALFILPFIYFNFFHQGILDFLPFTLIALVLNTALFIYFFTIQMQSKILVHLGQKAPGLSALVILLPMMSLSETVHHQNWHAVTLFLLVITFGADTGAWFFGQRFGKRQLCPQVSPSKTLEGLVWGVLIAGIVTTGLWEYILGGVTLSLFLLFCLLGVIVQMGDLIQSKIKRQFDIKDSSSLIPGHGGAYDRIDGLLFLTPFYSIMLRSYYLV